MMLHRISPMIEQTLKVPVNSRENTTGLPDLPNGQWWEVRPFFGTTYTYLGSAQHTVRDGYEVCLVTEYVEPATTKPGKHWWSAPVLVPEARSGKVVARQHITNPNLFRQAPSLNGLHGWYQLVGEEFITPAMVFKAAKDCVDQVEVAARIKAEDAERSRVSLGLVGKYPPKTLSL